jgi:hypothetical protein
MVTVLRGNHEPASRSAMPIRRPQTRIVGPTFYARKFRFQ